MLRLLHCLAAASAIAIAAGSIDANPRQDTGAKAVQGAVLELKADLRSLTVLATDKKPLTFRVTDATVIERNGMRIKLADLKTGQIVMVTYFVDRDERLARSIAVNNK